jgi:hypothetical protein
LVRSCIFFENFAPPFPEKEVRHENSNAGETSAGNSIRPPAATYDPGELDTIRKWLSENYEKSIKSVSLLLRQGHNFKQAPYEEISNAQYEIMMEKPKPITTIAPNTITSDECTGGMCPVR